MSRTFDVVLQRLRDFGQGKLQELDGLCDEHKQWLREAVAEVQQQLPTAAAGRSAKRRAQAAEQPAASVSEGRAGRASWARRLAIWAEQLPRKGRRNSRDPAPALRPQAAPAPAARGRARRGRAAAPVLETVTEEEEQGSGAADAAAPEPEPVRSQPAPAVSRPRRGRKQADPEPELAVASAAQDEAAGPSGGRALPGRQGRFLASGANTWHWAVGSC